jgi:phage shock protein C
MRTTAGRRYSHRQPWIYRDRESGWLLGVCAGLADSLGLKTGGVRIVLFVLLLIEPVTMSLAYVVAGLLLPERPLRYYGDAEDRLWSRERRRAHRRA